ncbi:MAG: hypothetical protein Q9159_000669 [Coniocarpon cinnabarinum]
MDHEFLASPKTPPPLNIPPSPCTVDVRIIDSTTDINLPTSTLVVPSIPGHENFNCPSYSFLISHGDRHLLFDLGTRKDFENLAPEVVDTVREWGTVERDVPEILDSEEGFGVKSKDIEAVIWSHHHWDHIGNMSLFPPSTALVVGPGFKEALMPGYPADPEGEILESDYVGREFREIDIEREGHNLTLHGFPAYDYFQDGSFYILSMPGHAPGHLGALARVTSDLPTFILLVGDACDHGGELRPSPYQPLPTTITPSPFPKLPTCPGALLQKLQSEHSAVKPFYRPEPDFPEDYEAFIKGLEWLGEWDGHENVLVEMAHDPWLKGCVGFFPDRANGWKERGVKERVRWRFLKDFEQAVEGMQ